MEPDIRALAASLELAVSPSDKAWFLAADDFAGTSNSAFKWNEWEKLSLSSAGKDHALVHRIEAHWDSTFPLLSSVAAGYSYCGLRRSDRAIVQGVEPEFEDVTVVCATVREWLAMLTQSPCPLATWL